MKNRTPTILCVAALLGLGALASWQRTPSVPGTATKAGTCCPFLSLSEGAISNITIAKTNGSASQPQNLGNEYELK